METTPPDHLPLTGERTVPGVPDEQYWFARHVVAYAHAATFVTGRRVLDAGCGEGYGLRLLAEAGARSVVGADLDGPTVTHARRRYGGPEITVVECELMALPLPDDAVDVTVSFQVIEHVHDVAGFLASLRRVTRPGGPVLVATPNRLTFTPDGDTPVNPFHHIEFAPTELSRALAAAGLVVAPLLGIHHGDRLRSWERTAGEPVTARMTSEAPAEWDESFRRLVHSVTVDDFELRADDLDSSLDLLAVCTVPDDPHDG